MKVDCQKAIRCCIQGPTNAERQSRRWIDYVKEDIADFAN